MHRTVSEMERHELQKLHYITPIENVPSILELGILSHVKASPVKHVSIAMQEIQDLRVGRKVPGGRRLHDYVPLYFHARNPMLYKRRGQVSSLCVLLVSTDVLDLAGVIVASCNASSEYCHFSPAPGGLRFIDRERTFAEVWTDDNDQIEYLRKKAAKCAEVLVPDQVDPKFISGACVGSEIAQQRLRDLAPNLPVSFNYHLFFC